MLYIAIYYGSFVRLLLYICTILLCGIKSEDMFECQFVGQILKNIVQKQQYILVYDFLLCYNAYTS